MTKVSGGNLEERTNMDWTPKALRLKAIDTSGEVFNKITGKSGNVWYYADNDAGADSIYVSTPDKNGMGGRGLNFILRDGRFDTVVGVWKSNCDSLLDDTGVDLRKCHKTFVVISRYFRHERGRDTFKEVIYMDDEPIVGHFDRGLILAQAFSDELQRTIYYYSQTSGGANSGCVLHKRGHKND